MNTRNTEDIIGSLYDLIQDARSMPLASDKCIIAIWRWICWMRSSHSSPAN